MECSALHSNGNTTCLAIGRKLPGIIGCVMSIEVDLPSKYHLLKFKPALTVRQTGF